MHWTETETEIMRDVFRFLKRHATPDAQNTVEWWERVHQDAGDICRKYDDHPLAVVMLVAGMGWMEKEMEKENVRDRAIGRIERFFREGT